MDIENKENRIIDFVLLWVDGNDPEWLEEKSRYTPSWQSDVRPERYRDWENLQYWFRGVEKYAPWVHKIYFVTWGHLPKWLNVNNPKLVIVNHKDYMPEDCLPTFNCNPLELQFHKIKGLSEQFVYFNDDMFLIDETKSTDFFKSGLPRDTAALNVHSVNLGAGFNFSQLQAIAMINHHFPFHQTLVKHWNKWFSPKNGKELLRTLYLLPCPRFPGIYQPHLPNSFLKSTYEEVWEKEYGLLNETCHHRFREKLDFTQYVMRNWQLASGSFIPRNSKIGNVFFIEKDLDNIQTCVSYIRKQKGKMVCVNDGDMTEKEFQENKQILNAAFQTLLPEKSSFEI